jgi:hypothetical protein
VSVSDFVFAVRLAGRGSFDSVIADVTSSVFTQAGCPPLEVARLVTRLKAVVRSGAAGAPELDLRFRGHPGWCEVTVSVCDREIWRASHPPVPRSS